MKRSNCSLTERVGCNILTILVLANVGGGLALVFHRPVAAAGVALLGLAVLWFLGTGLPARWLMRSLRVEAPLLPIWISNTSVGLVVFGDGVTVAPDGRYLPTWLGQSRLVSAAVLYREAVTSGAKCRIYVTGERTRKKAQTSDVYRTTLVALGVSPYDLTVDAIGENTFQHSKFTSEALARDGITSVAVVTSALHMKRSLLYLSHFGVDGIGMPSDWVEPSLSPIPLGLNLALTEIIWHQHVGIWRYRVYNLLGLNSRPR